MLIFLMYVWLIDKAYYFLCFWQYRPVVTTVISFGLPLFHPSGSISRIDVVIDTISRLLLPVAAAASAVNVWVVPPLILLLYQSRAGGTQLTKNVEGAFYSGQFD